MLRAALNYPTEGDRGAAALVVGSVLTFLLAVAELFALGATSALLEPAATDAAPTDPGSVDVTAALAIVLVVAAAVVVVLRVLLRGYYVAVHRAVVAGGADAEPVAPAFRGFRLVSDGVKSVVILVTYLVPTLVLGGVGVALRAGSGLDLGGQVVGTVGAISFLLAILALLAAAYLVPAAVTLFAAENRFLAAYHLRRVVRGAATETYAVGWVEAALIQVFVQPIAYAFQFLLFGVLFRFYFNVSVRYLWASGFADSLDVAAGALDTSDAVDAAAQTGSLTDQTTDRRDDSEANDDDRPDSLTGDGSSHAVRSRDRWQHQEPGEGDVGVPADEDDPLADDYYRRGEQ